MDSSPVLSFLEYYVGVFALLGLTATVVIGLLTTDRLILAPRHRVSAQVAHRAVSLVTLACLVTHVAFKVAEDHAPASAAVLPAGTPFFVMLGTLAADLFALVIVVGLVRGSFAGRTAARGWRTLHSLAYPTWGLAIWHGLLAGRKPAGWVDWSYGVCVAAVVLAVMTRVILPSPAPEARER